MAVDNSNRPECLTISLDLADEGPLNALTINGERVDKALTKTQQKELKSLLKDNALVDQVAEAVVMHKTAHLGLKTPPPNYDASTVKNLLAALQTARKLVEQLREQDLSMFNGSMANLIDHRMMNRIMSDGNREGTRFNDALLYLNRIELAVSEIVSAQRANKGGRPPSRGQTIYWAVVHIVNASGGKETSKIFPEVLRIALEAAGAPDGEVDRLMERERRSATRQRANKNRTNRRNKPT